MILTNEDSDTFLSNIIIDCQYFAPVNAINALFQFSNINIEQYESWQKMSFRNRMVVAGSNGPVHLSVPLEKGRDQRMLVKEVRISQTESWQKQHLRTIESAYRRSPFFEFYQNGIQDLLQKRHLFLLDLNLEIFGWLRKVLGNQSSVLVTEQIQKEYPAEIVDLRNYFLPKNYRQMTIPFTYGQVFEERLGFLPNLSILDLLFCCGPNAKVLLKDNKFMY